MFCKKCGRQLKDGASFCAYCGEKVVMPGTFARTEAKDVVQQVEREEIPVSQTADTDVSEPAKKRKTSKILLLVIIIGIALTVAAAVVAGYFLWSWYLEESEEDVEDSVREEKEVEPEESSADDSSESEEEFFSGQEAEDAEKESPPDEPAEEKQEEGIHTYELIVSDVTWIQAYEECLDRGGYLVRINSDEEYQAILQQISDEGKSKIKFWLGGTRISDDLYEYRWAYEDGSYGDEILNQDEKYSSYWLDGEPSYEDETVGSQEIYMNMFYMGREERWVWNDVPDDLVEVVSAYSGTIGYICEYED